MNDVRKPTTSRKLKLNTNIVVQRVAPQCNSSQPLPLKTIKEEDIQKEKIELRSDRKRKIWNQKKLRNVDRSNAEMREITINNQTILITEYKLKHKGKVHSQPSSSEKREGQRHHHRSESSNRQQHKHRSSHHHRHHRHHHHHRHNHQGGSQQK